MTTTLIKLGDQYAIVIDKELADSLGIDDTTPLSITMEGNGLRIEPDSKAARQERIVKAGAFTNERFGETLKKLSD